ncbi:MAG TPA: alpha/beta hydrolase [Gammaproteobacteria bacterium]
MREGSFLSLGPNGFHRVVYSDWGDVQNRRVLICVHGLTRNGRDFDTLANALSEDYRVVCPDVAGRGRSEWLPVKQDYGYPVYCADMAALIAHLRAESVDWLGTSMGGLIGMLLAATPGTPLRRLVMNDIGPLIPKVALERIASYVGTDPRFDNMSALDAYIREIYAPFGPLTDAQWRGLVESSARTTADGDIGLSYDPGIAEPLRAAPLEDIDLWTVWDAVQCPVLLLRGQKSDVLPAETAEEMQRRGPKTTFVELPEIGHAPALMANDQIGTIRDWLLSDLKAREVRSGGPGL